MENSVRSVSEAWHNAGLSLYLNHIFSRTIMKSIFVVLSSIWSCNSSEQSGEMLYHVYKEYDISASGQEQEIFFTIYVLLIIWSYEITYGTRKVLTFEYTFSTYRTHNNHKYLTTLSKFSHKIWYELKQRL